MNSCGGVGPAILPDDPPWAAAISVSPQSLTHTMIGETATFAASIVERNGAPVTWTSSALDVFTVDTDGAVTAVASGSGTVTAAGVRQ